jgi:hypothetical protein
MRIKGLAWRAAWFVSIWAGRITFERPGVVQSPTWWLVSRLYPWLKVGYIYIYTYNLLTKWDEPPSMNSSTIWPLIYPRDLIFSWHWEVAIDGYSHSHLKKLQRNGIWGIFLVYDEGNMCWHGSPCFCNSKMFQRFGMSQNFAAVHFCTFGSRSIAISTSIGMCFRASMWARGSSWT